MNIIILYLLLFPGTQACQNQDVPDLIPIPLQINPCFSLSFATIYYVGFYAIIISAYVQRDDRDA